MKLIKKAAAAAPQAAAAIPKVVENVPKPSADVTKYEVSSLSLRDIGFDFDVQIKNPYPVALKVSSIALDFIVEGSPVFQSKSLKETEIKGNSTGSSKFQTNLRFEDVIRVVKDYASKDYLSTVIKTQFSIPLPKIQGLPPTADFKFDLSRSIPAIKPSVSIANFKVKVPTSQEIQEALKKAGKASLQQAAESNLKSILSGKAPSTSSVKTPEVDLPIQVGFDIVLENLAGAVLLFKDLNFVFDVNKCELVKGQSASITQKGKQSIVSVNNSFSSKSLVGQVISAFNSGVGDFRVTGKTVVQLPEIVRKEPIPLQFTEEGKFNLR